MSKSQNMFLHILWYVESENVIYFSLNESIDDFFCIFPLLQRRKVYHVLKDKLWWYPISSHRSGIHICPPISLLERFSVCICVYVFVCMYVVKLHMRSKYALHRSYRSEILSFKIKYLKGVIWCFNPKISKCICSFGLK